jgi:tRNA(Ile)-lysidine synthase
VGPHPAVATVRHAVRRSLSGLDAGDLVLVACSGGPDSLALAAAVAFEAPRAGLRAGAVVVDHGLQSGSGELTVKVAANLTSLGLEPVLTPRVEVARPAGAGSHPGPEAAARAARYEALSGAAAATEATAVMLGHTLDDQAETVLLGLAQGSGARSLAGMAGRAGLYLRPLLEVRRSATRQACEALGLQPWDDPQNRDPAFTRARVRHGLMPALLDALGPGVPEALARTARLLRADADALDALASAEATRILTVPAPAGARAQILAAEGAASDEAEVGGEWSVASLAPLPAAIRHRILRTAALVAGCPARALAERHVASIDELVTDWHGQRWTDLPGGIRCQRRYGKLIFTVARADPPVSAAENPGPATQASAARGSPPEPAQCRDRRTSLDASDMGDGLKEVLISSEQLSQRIGELATQIDADYAERELLLVGVLKGAVMVMADLARAMHLPVQMDWMAISSYGSGTRSSGVVRILKDLDTDISGRHVLVVEDIVDSGLTLSWLLGNLRSRGPASLQVCVLLRKPSAARMAVDVAYTGFDIEDEFVVGYGLDYAERYRNLPFVGTLAEHVYGSPIR